MKSRELDAVVAIVTAAGPKDADVPASLRAFAGVAAEMRESAPSRHSRRILGDAVILSHAVANRAEELERAGVLGS